MRATLIEIAVVMIYVTVLSVLFYYFDDWVVFAILLVSLIPLRWILLRIRNGKKNGPTQSAD
jgi:hypothetical protein